MWHLESIIYLEVSSVRMTLNRAHTELRNYWKRNVEGRQKRQARQGRYQTKTESAFVFTGGKTHSNQGGAGTGHECDRKNTKNKT
jgi:hypothetical protein